MNSRGCKSLFSARIAVVLAVAACSSGQTLAPSFPSCADPTAPPPTEWVEGWGAWADDQTTLNLEFWVYGRMQDLALDAEVAVEGGTVDETSWDEPSTALAVRVTPEAGAEGLWLTLGGTCQAEPVSWTFSVTWNGAHGEGEVWVALEE